MKTVFLSITQSEKSLKLQSQVKPVVSLIHDFFNYAITL
jgi:hypothetical protein